MCFGLCCDRRVLDRAATCLLDKGWRVFIVVRQFFENNLKFYLHESENSQRSIEGSPKSPNDFKIQFYTTFKKQWKCVDNTCEETVTKCKDKDCDTTKAQFNSANYHPEVTKTQIPEIDDLDLSEILKLPNFPFIEVDISPFDNSGLIDLVVNGKDFSYYWSNSKQINKKCHDNICKITTRTCTNGKCDDKTTEERIWNYFSNYCSIKTNLAVRIQAIKL